MLINFEGFTIETRNILHISPVKKDQYGSHIFTITFLNKAEKSFHIPSSINSTEYGIKIRKASTREEQMKLNEEFNKIAKNKLNVARDQLIEYWKKDQNNLPTITIEEI